MLLQNRFVMLLVVVALVLSGRSYANENGCSAASLNGTYGLHATGTSAGSAIAAVGRFLFNGQGSLSGTLFLRVNGNNVGPLSITGTYSVSSACIVTDVWHISNGTSSTHKSVIVNNGTEYFILNTTSGEPSVISGEAKRQ